VIKKLVTLQQVCNLFLPVVRFAVYTAILPLNVYDVMLWLVAWLSG